MHSDVRDIWAGLALALFMTFIFVMFIAAQG